MLMVSPWRSVGLPRWMHGLSSVALLTCGSGFCDTVWGGPPPGLPATVGDGLPLTVVAVWPPGFVVGAGAPPGSVAPEASAAAAPADVVVVELALASLGLCDDPPPHAANTAAKTATSRKACVLILRPLRLRRRPRPPARPGRRR